MKELSSLWSQGIAINNIFDVMTSDGFFVNQRDIILNYM